MSDPHPTAPGLSGKHATKAWGRAELARLGTELAVAQEQLYAQAKVAGSTRRVLLVLQAMDCGGKDGTVKRVAGMMNPQGMHITTFGKPTEEELAHDFLWRIRPAVPAPGLIGIFNRSHYEDVLVVRVHQLVKPSVWRARYKKINAFESELARDGVAILKVMLHISYEEQEARLAERLTDPTKYWKFNPADLDERQRWADYAAAYEAALGRCHTEEAPWYVIPADRKWYRNWAVAQVLAETLTDLDPSYPSRDLDIPALKRRLKR